MLRIVKHIVTLALSTLFVGACVAACATDEPYDSGAFEIKGCPKNFCPAPAGAVSCCIDVNTCGVDYGMGCMAPKDGG